MLTLEQAARQVWREQVAPSAKNPKHTAQWIRVLEVYAFPLIGSRAVHTTTQADMLRVLAPIWTENRLQRWRVATRGKVPLACASAAPLA